ncbi:MAG: hypothetical protein HRU19_27555 [Pseudobacteriovorax sp.]|nr:hypothetical protein [Pseudobacteriovorax sp.]
MNSWVNLSIFSVFLGVGLLIACKSTEQKKSQTSQQSVFTLETNGFNPGCYTIASDNGKQFWKRSRAGTYSRTSKRSDAEIFYIAPVFEEGLILLDNKDHYVSIGSRGLLMETEQPDQNAEWRFVAQSNGLHQLFHIASNKPVARQIFNRLGTTDIPSKALDLTVAKVNSGCTDLRKDEPSLSYTAYRDPPSKSVNEPIHGYMDMHLHLFSNLAFNGNVISGAPFDKYGIRQALDSCRFEHGRNGLLDTSGIVQREKIAHSTSGFPKFSEWPNWDGYSHQTAYYRWLRRAHKSGLKIVNMLATNNSVVCKLSNGDLPCSDMEAVDRQIAGAFKLVDFLDWQAGGKGLG